MSDSEESKSKIKTSKIKTSKLRTSKLEISQPKTSQPKTTLSDTKPNSAKPIPSTPARVTTPATTTDTKPAKPFKVPQQRQISPELKLELRKREKAKRRSFVFFRFLKRCAFSLLVLAIPAAIAGVIYRNELSEFVSTSIMGIPANQSISSIDSVDEQLPPPVETVATASTGQLLEKLYSLNDAVVSGVLPKQLMALQENLQLTDELLTRDTDRATLELATTRHIDSLISLVSISVREQLELTEYRDQLLTFCSKQTTIPGADDRNLRITSHRRLGTLVALIDKFLSEESADNLRAVQTACDELTATLTPNLLQHFLVVNSLLGQTNDSLTRLELQRRLARGLVKHGSEEQQNLGLFLLDQAALGPRNYALLRHLVAKSDHEAIAELETIIQSLSDDPNVSSYTFQDVLMVLGGLRESKEAEREPNLRKQLKAAHEKIADEQIQQAVAKLIEAADARDAFLGQTLDLKKLLTHSQSETVGPLAMIFLIGTHAETIPFLKEFEQYNQRDNPIKFLIVCTETEVLPEQQQTDLKAAMPSATFIFPTDNQPLLQVFPVSHTPLIVVLDATNKVRAVDISPGRLLELFELPNHTNTDSNPDEMSLPKDSP